MTPRQIERRLARARLSYGHGARHAREEAAWLLAKVKNKKRAAAVVERRVRERIPLAYLLKEAWLGKHRFYVDERAIVPRSFIAELLRERLRPWLQREPRQVLDLCTGSGCLAVLLALTFRKARVDASDISGAALQVAGINVRKYRLGKRIRLFRSDLFHRLKNKTYDLIVCNPPYVTAQAMRKLPKEYRHEPSFALAGGVDGLALVRKIILGANKHLRPDGLLVCEIGGNRRALERVYPRTEFTWPDTSDASTVFVLKRGQLPRAAKTGAATRIAPTRGRARR